MTQLATAPSKAHSISIFRYDDGRVMVALYGPEGRMMAHGRYAAISDISDSLVAFITANPTTSVHTFNIQPFTDERLEEWVEANRPL